ncbi:MAG TPA: hypothetical protein VN674_13755 [Gemmatimonadales bacterium]|nr:hypothetical protein [Gemmatimonadales bacterium]
MRRGEVKSQRHQVRGPLAQIRQAHHACREALIEIPSKSPALYRLSKFILGCGYDAKRQSPLRDVHHTADLLGFQNTEQFRLRIERQTACLVEEQGASGGSLNKSGRRLPGAREGVLPVPKEPTVY